jgi:hypothetical protein
MKILFIVFAAFSLTSGVFAQVKTLNRDWLAGDIKMVGDFAGISQVKPAPYNEVERRFASNYLLGDKKIYLRDAYDFGFGFKRFHYQLGSGYCDFYVGGFILNGDYARYETRVDCGHEWKQVRDPIISAWKNAGGPPFTEEHDGIFSEKSYNDVIERYKERVNSALGPMKPEQVPVELQKYYDYLIDPMENSVVGIGGCGYGGGTPAGKGSIDLFIAAKRIDLLENILRGYNPGGRIYAAMALLKMEEDGVKLDPKTRETIEKVANLDIDIQICRGCIYSDYPGKEVLKILKF